MSILSQEMESYSLHQKKMQRMFKAGTTLLRIFGKERICDFSLGYSKERPSEQLMTGLQELTERMTVPGALGYLPNEGEMQTRHDVAAFFNSVHQTQVSEHHLLLTCGASGALNVLLRSILARGDEVLCPAPAYPEYAFNVANFGGAFIPVPTVQERNFHLDLEAFASAITSKTRCIILNSPNNPTGTVYNIHELSELASLLTRASRKFNRPIVLAVDESCGFITYDNTVMPDIFSLYPYSVLIGSFSKMFPLAGERLGYAVINPHMPKWKTLFEALVMSNRILGYINAPVLGQHLLQTILAQPPDLENTSRKYTDKRRRIAQLLDEAGIQYTLPEGSFFFFPKVPGNIGADSFVCLLALHKIFVLSGSLYGCPRHFRLAFCTDNDTIERSRNGFKRVTQLVKII